MDRDAKREMIEQWLVEHSDDLRPRYEEPDDDDVPPDGMWTLTGWVLATEWLPLEPTSDDDDGQWTVIIRGKRTSNSCAIGMAERIKQANL